jgi:hypothetical protein
LSIVFGGGSLGKRGQLCGGFFYAFPARAFYLLIAVGRVWSCLRLLRELDHKSNQIKVWTKFLPHTRPAEKHRDPAQSQNTQSAMCGKGQGLETLNKLLRAEPECGRVTVAFGNHMN